MKKILSAFCFFVAVQFNVQSQCDIAQKDFSISPKNISIGSTAEIKFSVYNAGKNTTCSYPAGAIEVVLSLPATGYAFEEITSPALGKGEYFDWTYDAIEKVLIGINHKPIPSELGDYDIRIKVKGVSNKKATSVLNIGVVDGSPNLSIDNDPALSDLTVSAAVPLPVRLISFAGKPTNKGNQLNWVTSSEQNFSHYEIEKSKDAKVFTKIGKVFGAGNSKENLAYSFLDEINQTGMLPGAQAQSLNISEAAYYRLKMVDKDGVSELSKVIFVSTDDAKSIVGEFYPSPIINNEANININSAEKMNWTITSFDIDGRVLTNETKSLEKGGNKVNVNIDKSKAGITIFRIENANDSHIRKVLKQ
jgi:hypothetical protein